VTDPKIDIALTYDVNCRDFQMVLSNSQCCTNTGYPAGNESFVMRLEGLTEQILMPKSRGRPRKSK